MLHQVQSLQGQLIIQGINQVNEVIVKVKSFILFYKPLDTVGDNCNGSQLYTTFDQDATSSKKLVGECHSLQVVWQLGFHI